MRPATIAAPGRSGVFEQIHQSLLDQSLIPVALALGAAKLERLALGPAPYLASA